MSLDGQTAGRMDVFGGQRNGLVVDPEGGSRGS